MSKALFLLGCIPTRILLFYIAYLFSNSCEKKQGLKNLFSLFIRASLSIDALIFNIILVEGIK